MKGGYTMSFAFIRIHSELVIEHDFLEGGSIQFTQNYDSDGVLVDAIHLIGSNGRAHIIYKNEHPETFSALETIKNDATDLSALVEHSHELAERHKAQHEHMKKARERAHAHAEQDARALFAAIETDNLADFETVVRRIAKRFNNVEVATEEDIQQVLDSLMDAFKEAEQE
jgi:hypothetical protein